MDALDAYLTRHYRTADQLAALCSISSGTLAGLVGDRLVPGPSYLCTEPGRFVSRAFGEFEVRGMTPAQYFHPGNAAWIALALAAKEELGPRQAHDALKARFVHRFAAALETLNKSVFRLTDSFDDDGRAIQQGLDARTERAWSAFLDGIFSLCVADPSSEASIARKEILQEALSELDDARSRSDLSPERKRLALELIERYAQAAMPFSPLEYPRSSRKRLVEDLRAKLGAR